MDWEVHPEMDTPGWYRAIGQLRDLTDFFCNSFSPHSWVSGLLAVAQKCQTCHSLCLEASSRYPYDQLPPLHLKIRLLNGPYSDDPI